MNPICVKMRNEARANINDHISKKMAMLFSSSDTTGEKDFEEFLPTKKFRYERV